MSDLKKQYPNLKTIDSVDCGSWVLAAKNIRVELKKSFPEVKFSVKSSSFSMGNSVNVNWTDGPTTKAVDEIINKYQYGSFDGMTDSYEYDNSDFNEMFGGSKYVSSNRNYSIELTTKAVDAVAKKFGINDPKMTAECFNAGETYSILVCNGQGQAQTLIHQELADISAIVKETKQTSSEKESNEMIESENQKLVTELKESLGKNCSDKRSLRKKVKEEVAKVLEGKGVENAAKTASNITNKYFS